MERLTGYDMVAGAPYADLLVGVTEQEVASKLAAYEDAEEQGLLVRLPCYVGDTVYWYDSENCPTIIPCVVNNIIHYAGRGGGTWISVRFEIRNNVTYHSFHENSLGKTVLLTHEAAEAKLNA